MYFLHILHILYIHHSLNTKYQTLTAKHTATTKKIAAGEIAAILGGKLITATNGQNSAFSK